MIGKLKFYTALVLSRFIYVAIKLLNKSSGTSFVGMVTLKICPEFLSYCPKYIRKKIVNITGTNGKSTTSGLIAHILETANQSVVHNLKGANMITGIANSFALAIKPFKKFDYGVLETDEAYLRKVYDYINADFLLVTNLFRDQLDRYGELETTAKYIQEAINKNPKLNLILNADDPLVSNFGRNRNNVVYYGLSNVEYAQDCKPSNSPTEIFNCVCGQPLSYTKTFFAQEGHYRCPCGYARPNCNYSAKVKIYNDKTTLVVTKNDIDFSFDTQLVGLYNAYNLLGAIVFAFENGLNQSEIQKALNTYKTLFGRTEKTTMQGHSTIIQLIKNPTGASEVLKTVDINSQILIAINDNYADGRDISWLWDTDFEKLKDAKKITVSGSRAYDVATRLKYADVNPENINIIPEISAAIKHVLSNCEKNDNITILPSYTALLKLNKMKIEK